MIYTLQKEVILGTTLEEAWDFLSKPSNLNRITPPDLNFTILSMPPDTMHEGLIIKYSIRIPGFGRQLWLTEIKHIREKHSFVDEQRFGPFQFWYHYHGISKTEKGTRSLDHVTYIMPLKMFGTVLHTFYVRRTLERIFSYREQQLRQLFPRNS